MNTSRPAWRCSTPYPATLAGCLALVKQVLVDAADEVDSDCLHDASDAGRRAATARRAAAGLARRRARRLRCAVIFRMVATMSSGVPCPFFR